MTAFRWGILGASGFARRHMIPAMQAGRDMEVVAIASRSAARAEAAAREHGIARAHGSYGHAGGGETPSEIPCVNP